jgi:hypothetical protein
MEHRESIALIANPSQYLSNQSRSLDERIDDVRLGPGAEEAIAEKATRKIIRDKILGIFRIGQIVSAFISWNEGIDRDIRDAKKNALLSEYFNKADDNSDSIDKLKNFVTNPQGNTLFNKIMRILDDSPPDADLMDQLSSALLHIINSDFASMFEEHRYALSQIERLSPPALMILADHMDWPVMKMGSYSLTGSKVTSDWLTEFERAYAEKKGIKDRGIQSRMRHSIDELINLRVIEAHMVGDQIAKPVVVDLGYLILPYITKLNHP